jgi:excisionase family DNA binding protein
MLKVMKMSIGRDQGVLPTMLTDGDVARALMISKSTLRRIIARKEIKFTYSGKRRRYLPEHVVEYLKTQDVDGCPSQPRECEFQRIAARHSDLIAATIPI